MNKELIINSLPSEVEIALVENNKLVEIHRQKTSNSFNVGDIYLARVNKLMAGLNAAFLDIGSRKDAFLHYTDLGPKLPSVIEYTKEITNKSPGYSIHTMDLTKEIHKNGKIQDVMDKRTMMLVQILKEPISTKGPRLSCEITIPGRYLVLTPFSNAVTISKKIVNVDERKRLQLLIESIKPKNFGIIARTAAEGRKVADLHDEINGLAQKWNDMEESLKEANGPQKILSEADKTTSLIRDFLTNDYQHIVVNDKEIYNNVKTFMTAIAPDKVKIVEHYTGKAAIFEHYGINKQIKASFGKTATMNSGAYLVIEHT
ncbi:MAG TPA: ribonuclease E/G, partial [Saprospiraceae bacterium]|nr:ribonuclease E/G [Saprospiraceae bacterium]